MANYHIGGTLYNAANTTVEAAIRETLAGLAGMDVGELNVKVRLFGYDFASVSEQLEFYLNSTDNAGIIWYLTADLKGAPDELNVLVSSLTSSLIKADILYLIDYSECDEDDEPISEEVTLSHPEFDERYTPPAT